MTPSIEIRNMAALYHAAMTNAEDEILKAEDEGMGEDVRGKLIGASLALSGIYEDFCKEQGFELVTDASGLFLRCAETGIPLVIGDEYDELETGECVLVKRAA